MEQQQWRERSAVHIYAKLTGTAFFFSATACIAATIGLPALKLASSQCIEYQSCALEGTIDYTANPGDRYSFKLRNAQYACVPILIDNRRMRKLLARSRPGSLFRVEGPSLRRGPDGNGADGVLALAYFDRWLPFGTCPQSTLIIYANKLDRLPSARRTH
jgi:hypothetical protein